MENQTIGRPTLLKNLNYRAVLDTIAYLGGISRAGIADQLRLSRPSVSRIVDSLLRASLLREGERIASKAGRPQTLLNINPDAAVVAGLDIRPRKIRLILADLQGTVLQKAQVATQAQSAEHLVQQAVGLVRTTYQQLGRRSPLVSAAVGISGAWDEAYERVYAIPNIACLEGRNLAVMLQSQLDCKIAIDNDVNYAAIGEHVYGAAHEQRDFFYFNLGSGIGGSAVIGGQLQRGVRGFAGELGYLLVKTEEGTVPLERVASRIALSRVAQKKGLADDALELFDLAAAGDREATELIGTLADHVALALVAVVVTLNPALIVLGGSLGRRSDVLIPILRQRVEDALPVCPPVVPTQLREDAPLRGAVARAIEDARAHLLEKELAHTA